MFLPLVYEIPYQDPLCVFTLFKEQSGALLLQSAQLRLGSGRYSFIAVEPFATLVSKNGNIKLNEKERVGDPFVILQQELARFSQIHYPELPPFQGGVAGYFGYDLCHHLENVSFIAEDDMQFPDMALGFYDVVIGFDEVEKRAWIFSSGHPKEENERKEYAKKRLKKLLNQLGQRSIGFSPSTVCCDEKAITSNFTALTYSQAVNKVIESILAGDIFEANISQRFRTFLPRGLTAFDLYWRLTVSNPVPFAAYIHLADTVIVSSSPERFIKLTGRHVETCPIKGTRGRGDTSTNDAKLANELLTSEKDRAENMMIVDLLRNDLSRVCLPHSVKAPILCQLETYPSVHHLVSVVTGTLVDGITAIDLLRAAFPGGSITGAPKIRAMEVIADIEPTARGPYCGSIGYIGFNGDMDTSITIRTFCIKNNNITFQTGGAVVADSDPDAEYQETLIKANALKRVLVNDFINR